MAWLDDHSVDFTTGNIRRVSGTTRYPVIDMHRGLMTLTAQATASGDDLGDITDLFVPSRRASDTDITLNSPMNIDAATAEGMYGGSVIQASGDERYSGLDIAGSFPTPPRVYQNGAYLTTYWGVEESPDAALGYAVRLLVLSRTGGADIDGGRVRVESRAYSYQYRSASTVLGANASVAGLGTINLDTFNQTAIGTIAAIVDITNTEGFQEIDLGNGSGPVPFYSRWNKGANTPNDVYEYIKWATREGTSETLYGLPGDQLRGVEYEVSYDNEASGPFSEASSVTFGNGATAQVLALDDDGTTGKLYIQMLTGLPPSDNDSITQGGTTADIAGTPVSRSLGVESIAGNFTGAWQGAYGVGFIVADLVAADSVIDLDNSGQTPLNNQTIFVGTLVDGESRVILGREDGTSGNILKSEYAAAAGNDNGDSTLTVKTNISDAPPSGTVRISNGVSEDVYAYTSFSGGVFTLSGTLSTDYAEDADVYVTFLDGVPSGATFLSNIMPFSSPIRMVGLVTDDGSVGSTPIVPFPLSGNFTSTGFSVNAVQTADA